ncbi:hypothetical protein [Lysinibacillus xylanilyticus]|uniref:hypothetical protein n=1 Tax=Lysinibacillus xylanilyticus TaxID=582475 RepID=UPI003CFDBE13
MNKNFKKLNTIALIVIWALYCISLKLPVFSSLGWGEMRGLGILLMGWLGFVLELSSTAYVSWYANLFFIYISIQTFRGKKTSISHLFMLLLASGSFFPMKMLRDEAGGSYVTVSHNLGFYFWISAIVLLSTLVFINLIMSSNRNN